ncbi:adhesin [uncultured Methanobrevibacter sp.]|uniref:adhesin n=1 Tax=uncultured Methanobrevibacter sp. TaxID=253161 RepID=UPI00341D29D3
MKFNKIFLFTLILLAALSVSAVSAESFDGNNTVTVNDVNNVIVSEQISADNTADVIGASEPSVSDVNENENTGDNGTTPDTNGSTENNSTSNDTNSSIISEDLSLFFRNGTKFSAIFLDEDGNPLANTNITFIINGVNYTRATDAKGVASIAINLAAGEYSVKSINPATNESVINNLTVISTISAGNIIKLYKNGTQYYATFVDGQGNVLVNKTVKFNINGVFYQRDTDENGTARLNINLYPGEYILTAYNPINNEAIASNITVISTINGSDIKKYYRNGTQYTATLVDSNGNILANKTVRLNINGVFYNRTTNENGTVTLNINLMPGNYTITVYNPTNGEENSNNVLVLSKLVAKDVKMDYQSGGKYSVTVLDDQGNTLANKTVKLNIHGVFYERVTNENGTAYLNINLIPGVYTCTAYYGDSVTSSQVTVNKLTPSINVLTPTVKKGDYYKVKVTEKKSGNPIVNHLIIFVYNGTAYGAFSDADGVAKIKIGLPVGTYRLVTGIQQDPWYTTLSVWNIVNVTA